MTYGLVAARAGKPGAARAVGTIMANNDDKTVPCHRVIRSDGKIGGYNGINGPSKRELLVSEGVPSLRRLRFSARGPYSRHRRNSMRIFRFWTDEALAFGIAYCEKMKKAHPAYDGWRSLMEQEVQLRRMERAFFRA